MIHLRESMKGFVPVRAMDFLLGQFDQLVQVPRVTVLQQRIEQHRAERRREREREPGVHAVALPALHRPEQRQIGFGDGLEQPVLLEKLLVLRMPDERQVRVKDEGEIALHRDLKVEKGG